ncbi:thioester domain-containing protein [Mycolicibacterium brisbanense]|nr:thioester domain-containing protein [Mycolicibacterium brisbanense]MCV7157038.1 TQXA domain-containing protein [Mycolicibacterium brisbanense]
MPVLPVLAPISTPVAVRRRVRARDVEIARMTRYRGGTYSPTVDTIVFADGSTARTDLIRLNPNIDAYSVDFTGVAPTTPSRYRPANWSAVPNLAARTHEAEVDWIIRNSYPTLGTAELSRRLRAAGRRLGAHLAEHEAIAATQAAIWHFTNGLDLDTRPLNVPVAQRREPGAIVFEFDGDPQLGGYTVELAADSPVSLLLQKSADGIEWRDVAASGLNIDAGQGSYRKALGIGSTTAATRPGRRHQGYRFYRLHIVAAATVEVASVTFWLNGSGHYRNAQRVVALYQYLLAGAAAARRATVVPVLDSERAVLDAGVLGPFRLDATDRAALSVSAGTVVDADGAVIDGAVTPGTDFYLRPGHAAGRVTLTASVPAATDGFGGRVITGVAYDDSRFTPVALAVPAPTVIEFEISF